RRERAARAMARAVERAAAFRRDASDLPAAVVLDDEERARYRTPLPRSGVGLEAVGERVANDALPRAPSHSHTRSCPFSDGAGLEAGVAAAVLAAALDANLGGGAAA